MPNPTESSPTRIGDLEAAVLARKLARAELVLRTGSVHIRVVTGIRQVADLIRLLYRDYPLATDERLPDGELRLFRPSGLHRWWRPQANCLVDGRPPFEALPLALAYPMLEWAMNWTTANRMQRFFMIHAAVAAHGDRALILPAWSGSGKSTLCAALVHRGWRLLSDEFCMLGLDDGRIHPVPRPIPLKNESIAAFRRFEPDAVMGPTFFQTRKGDIAHLRPPRAAIERSDQTAAPAWVVLPRYQAGSGARLAPLSANRALLLMASNSFNFNLLGTPAFDALGRLIKQVSCHRIAYSDLDQAVDSVGGLLE